MDRKGHSVRSGTENFLGFIMTRKFSWLHYAVDLDAVFCFPCMNAANKQKLGVSTNRDDAFIARGYKNWKWGTTGLKTHEASECHREVIEVIELPRKCAEEK